MRIRDVYLANQQTLNDSDTVQIDLSGGLKILYLRIQYQDQNGSTSNTLCRLAPSVSKIQLVDGANVLRSTSMIELQAKNCWDYKRFPYRFLSSNDDDVIVEEALMDFRRFPGDTSFYLDTSNYKNPQLLLTHSFTIDASAGFVTDQGKLTVIARVIDSGAPSRLGFVSVKEIDSFATAAAGDHITNLPLDYPLAEVMVFDPVDANTPDKYLSNFLLTADTDAYIPVDTSWLDLMKENELEFGLFDELMRYPEDTSATLLFGTYNHLRPAIGVSDSVGLPEVETVAGNEVTIAMTTGGDPNMSVAARGACPSGGVIYRFGDGQSPDQILSPQGIGKLQLKLTQANTGATAKVVITQQRP